MSRVIFYLGYSILPIYDIHMVCQKNMHMLHIIVYYLGYLQMFQYMLFYYYNTHVLYYCTFFSIQYSTKLNSMYYHLATNYLHPCNSLKHIQQHNSNHILEFRTYEVRLYFHNFLYLALPSIGSIEFASLNQQCID